jgi:mono/diheme cytochrome c family protein
MKWDRLTLMLAAAIHLTNPAQAQDDLPPVGHSRFDQLIGSGPVPYPFPRLVNKINAQMQQDRSGLPPLKITLIPLGRSLQRNAGTPDFFRFPRVVAAADGDNRPGFAPLKDRLFLGFHEKGEVVEVISYNDAAGRFEFQVVRDYARGKSPRLFYARRSLCQACHQNSAPIFARPLWDETPANPAIAERLRSARRDFYGVKLTGTDIAYFIDASSERANLFSVWQTLWQQGCGEGEAGERCRMQAFAAALEYARAGRPPGADVLPELDRNWKTRWPQGLPIPNPDLPNRDPLAALQDPANDPLLLRPPLAHWHAADKTAFVVGLAGMLDPAAVKQLGHRELSDPLERLRSRGELKTRPFGQSLLQALLSELGIPRQKPAMKLPPARAETAASSAGAPTLFRTHCALCHDTTSNVPPNFLHGDSATVNARLDHCAQRIFYRLSMWNVAETQRGKSPMPPPAILAARGMDAAGWARSPYLAALLDEMRNRIRAQGGQPEKVLAQPFDQLRSCLPQPHAGSHQGPGETGADRSQAASHRSLRRTMRKEPRSPTRLRPS